MPEYLTPGVYVEEVSSDPQIISGASLSITGFIGQTLKGPINEPIKVTSFSEYERTFGGARSEHPMNYAIHHYYVNGGQEAVVVRVEKKENSLIHSNNHIGFNEIAHPDLTEKKHGLWAFDNNNQREKIALLCIPPFAPNIDVDNSTWQTALNYCKDRKIFLIVDPPLAWKTIQDISQNIERMNLRDRNAAIYFPYLEREDPANKNQRKKFAPCGTVAGIIVRIDSEHGVWKAPAGVDALLSSDLKPINPLSKVEFDKLLELSVNSFYKIQDKGWAIWGARTLANEPEWKYISVRRTFMFIHESLDQGLQWTVFEPNGEPLWDKIRHTISEFMFGLWRQGAIKGARPEDAFFVSCDRSTMKQNDIENGRVIVIIGVSLLRPTEFTILRLGMWTASAI